MADEYDDLKQMLQQQLKLMEALTVKLSYSSAAGGSKSVDHIAGSVTEFLYDSQAYSTFDSWYKRYEDFFSVNLAAQDDTWKVRLLLCKLGPVDHEHYAYFIPPKNPREITFANTLKTLHIFGEQSSLFNTQSQCLQLCKCKSDDSITYAGGRQSRVWAIALTPNCYPLLATADLFTLLNGGTYLTKFDLADAYLQVEVTPQSR
ncbi:unnamed protein product [Schistocephalus solidus]|uniref:Reverse transcriptase domain-containing protein n=1 Tax=Schistocephalus solidus TaxID=70667 RepID=A0A183SEQ3_SCHSO|nr:unnamed protein product [Schistocephalus solidus]